MLTKNILNISFFITIVLFASVYTHTKKSHEESRLNSLMDHSKIKNTPKPSLLQMTQGGFFPTLDDAMSVDVKQYEGSCSDLFEVREALNSYLNQFANYTPQVLDNDLSKLQSAQTLVSQVLQHLSGDVPSLVQLGSKVQLQESLSVMEKLNSLNMVKQVSVDDVKDQIAQYLNASTIQTQKTQAEGLLSTLSKVISQVSSVKEKVFDIEAVKVLESKKQAVLSMIKSVCFSQLNPVVNNTQFDEADENVVSGRTYRYYDEEPNVYPISGENITEALFKDFVVGGWVRWLDFINGTFDHSNEEVLIARLTSETYEDLEEDVKFADLHVKVFASANGYKFCTHNIVTDEMNVCHTFDLSEYTRENTWHFLMFMYSFDTKTAIARVRVAEEEWLSYQFPSEIEQTPFNGTLTFYLGHDAFFGNYGGFNGELHGWDLWYGINSWLSEEVMWTDDAAEGISLKYFDEPVAVPYVEKVFQPNKQVQKQNSGDTSLFTYINSFWEAQDYGFAIWFKLDHERAFAPESKQLATLAFESRTDVNTPGNAIADVFIENGYLYVSVAYEKDNQPATSRKQLAAIYKDDWFLVQIQFSTSDGEIRAYFEQEKEVTKVSWDDVSRVYIPANLFLSLGSSPIVNNTGADFEFKSVWVYSGVQEYFGQPCDDACVTCNGPESDDCTSCNDGFYVNNGQCSPCDDGCKVCQACGECSTSECTQCQEGLFLNEGKCGCDDSCETCSGPSANDCTSCQDTQQYVLDGHCEPCDESCAKCSGPAANDCTECPDGYKVDPAPGPGECVTICDYDRCEECNEDGSECISCNEPLVLSDGDCVPCDESCKTCSGPEDYQCTECDPPKQFLDGRCFVCNESCLTCEGPNADDCLTCESGNELINGQCVPPCDTNTGFFRNGTECLPCNETCKTCNGGASDNCTSCPEGFYLEEGVCKETVEECDTNNGYIMVKGECIFCDINNGSVLINDECIPCDETCKTCSGPSDTDCLSCTNPNYFVTNGKCGPVKPICDEGWVVNETGDCVPCSENCTVCPDDYKLVNGTCEEKYEVLPECNETQGETIVNGDCVPCNTECKTCQGAVDNCTSCSNEGNYYMSDDGQCLVCDLQNGSFFDSNGTCLPCSQDCLTCEVSEDHCTSCNGDYVLNDNFTCNPPCETEEGWFLNSNGTCLPCSKDCWTCEESEDHCTSCYDDYVLNDNFTCSPPCDTDNGFVSINDECLPCDDTCKTCSGQSYLDCIECAEGLEYLDDRCVEPCNTTEGYVLVDGKCLPCHESCQTCSDTSNTDCTSCVDTYVLQAGECVFPQSDCETDNGFVIVNEQCVPCDDSCKNCDGVSNTDCTECFEGYILSSGACVEPQPDCNTDAGQVLINGECYDCDPTCKTCDGVAATDCTECVDGLDKEGDLCVKPCNVTNGFYKKEGACLPCDDECLTCDGPENGDCLTCPEGYFLQNGKCIPEECLNENYNFTEAENQTCTSDCDCDGTRRCSPNGVCHDCNYLAEAFPNNFTTDHCPPCNETCQTCRGSRPNDCVSCLANEILVDGYCKPCDESCKTCNGTGSNDCLTCEEGIIYQNGSCIVPCDTDNGYYYEDSQTCSPCDKDCKSCNGSESNQCTDCYEGYELKNGECKVPCDTDNGYFYDENRECQPCDDSCVTCDGPSNTNCTECDEDYFMEFGKCKPTKCVEGEYNFDENIINECNSDCECDGTRRCSPEGQCKDCKTLADEFPNQFIPDVCPPCNETCETCRGPNSTDCTTCIDHFYLNASSCLPCDETCNTCSGPSSNECIDCNATFVFKDGLCLPPCDTENGFFYDSDNNCSSCQESCKTCLNDSSCESCYGRYILEDGICKPPCDVNKGYTYNEAWECVSCNDTCKTCNGTTSKNCTSCEDGYTLFEGECLGCVSFSYDFDESNNVAGPSQCSSDCECDNTRRCSPEGVCEDCESVADRYPELYDALDCPACNETCLTCHGPGPNNCTTCHDGDYLGIDNACYPCDDSCSTCDGPSETECSACNEGFILVDGECQVPKPECDESCKECNGTTAQNCTSCFDDYELVDNECKKINCVDWDFSFDESTSPLGKGRCDDDCECDNIRRCGPSKYCHECLDLVALYPDLYDLKDCPSCDDSCKTCSGPSANDCSSCSKGNYLTDDNTCEPCDDNCAKCAGTSTNCTACPAGFELENRTCVEPCNETCETCSGPGPKNCTSCSGYKILIDNECLEPNCTALNYSRDETENDLGPNKCTSDCDCDSSRRCSPDGQCQECMYLAVLYPGLYNKTDCPPCDETCLTCQGPTADDCTYCNDGWVLIGGNCKPCDSSCLTCNDVDANHCLSCDEDKVLKNGTCEEVIECDPTCVTCSGPEASNCTSCADDKVLNDGYCEEPDCINWNWEVNETEGGRCSKDCECNAARRCSPDGYCEECDSLAKAFPSVYNIDDCPPCNESCATCSGPNDDDCTSCDSGYFLVNGECEPCDESCATCSGVNDNDCLSCPEGMELKDGECVEPCDESCLTCTGTTKNDCSSCDEGYFLAWDNSCQEIDNCVKYNYTHDESTNELGPNRCYDDCDCDNTRRCSPDGYCTNCLELVAEFPEQYFEVDCPVCDDSCLSCDGPADTNCTACADGFVLIDGTCVPCESTCLTCAESADNCTSCTDPLVLKDGNCEEVQCEEGCLECNCEGAGCCTVCADNKVLNDNGDCDDRDCVNFNFTFNESTNENRCDHDCQCNGTRRCSPDKYCEECFDLVFQYPTLYAFSDCPPCNESCGSCNGPSASDCTDCKDGYTLSNGECLPCHETCKTCQSNAEDGCITCKSGYELQEDGTCQEIIECDPTCKTCNGTEANNCTSCEDGYHLDEGKCAKDCIYFNYVVEEAEDLSCVSDCGCDGTRRCSPSGYCMECIDLANKFPSLYSSDDCPPCDESCKYCNGPDSDNCIACEDSEYLAENGTCQPCNNTCLTCDGANDDDCTSCEEPLVLNQGYCVNPPPQCDETCKTCTGSEPSDCSSCYEFYELVDGYCEEVDCVDFDYEWDESTNTDGPQTCTSNCHCSGSRVCGPDNICESCIKLSTLYPDIVDDKDCPPCDDTCGDCVGPSEKECISCLNESYALVNGECVPCDTSCLTCSGPDANDCDTCPEGKVLSSEGECVDPPPECDESCATCSGSGADECSSCDEPKVLVDGKCIDTNDCVDWDYVYEEAETSACSNDCECNGTKKCSPYGYCHECLWVVENFPDQNYSAADCPPCDSSCSTCDGPNADNCLSCDDGFYLAENNTCQPCDETCLTCNGGNRDDCTSCESPRVLDNGYCDIPLEDCDETCLECKGSLPTDCISCQDNWRLTEEGTCEKINCIAFDYEHDESSNTGGAAVCDDDCDCNGSRRCGPSKYCDSCLGLAEVYPEQYPASKCPACDETCKDCDGPDSDNCIECEEGEYLFNGECIVCDENCDTCFGPDEDNCLSCKEGQVLYEKQCWTPDPECDPSCVTCSGPGPNECKTCKCDEELVDGYCVAVTIVCDETCETCYGSASNQCSSCPEGRVLLSGECVVVSSFVGVRSEEDTPISYRVPQKYIITSDIGLGSWTKLKSFVQKNNQPNQLLFRLSALSKADKSDNTNQYRHSTLAVYHNSSHYTFETYSKMSGLASLVQKSIHVGAANMVNKWNLVFFGYSRKNSKASGFVKLNDGNKYEVSFDNIYQDTPEEKMEVFFYGDQMYRGINGEVSSPEILHGNNFLQNFGGADYKNYFKLEAQE